MWRALMPGICRLGFILLTFSLGWVANAAAAQASPDCAKLNAEGAIELPHSVYLPPLLEDTAYSLANPGRLADAHLPILRELADRAVCAARARQISLGAIRLLVIARTDDRGAREHIKKALRQRGVEEAQIDVVARSVVDTVAAWHRSMVLVERLQQEVRQAIQSDPQIGNIDPASIVQAGNLINGAVAETGRLWGVPAQPHPRSFIVVIHQSPGTPASVAGRISSEIELRQPTTINIYCGESGCVPNTKKEMSTSAPQKRSILRSPQMDALIGVAIATQSYTRKFLYREIGWLGLGLRLPIWIFEFGLRLNAHVSYQPIELNNYIQNQLRLGMGADVLIGGLLVNRPSVRLALGLNGGWLYLYRRIERIDTSTPAETLVSPVHAPHAGGWLRLDVPLPRFPRLALSTEVAIGVAPFMSDNQVSPNLTTKILGGVAYAVR